MMNPDPVDKIVQIIVDEMKFLDNDQTSQRISWLRFNSDVGKLKNVRTKVEEIVAQQTDAKIRWLDPKNIEIEIVSK